MVVNSPLPRASHVARLAADQATARRLSDVFAESFEDQDVAAAAYEGTDGAWTFALHFPEPPNETAVRALVALAANAHLANTLVFERIEPKDWVAASLQGLAPVEAGRFSVHGKHDRSRVCGPRIGIEIEAALAFGTGHHGTTRGCLLALDELVKHKSFHFSQRPRRLFPPRGEREKRARGMRILDIGTGTGVLAIAAAKALRRRVLASDIDPSAARIARENARLNTAGTWVEVIHASGLSARRIQASGPFDVIFANILLGPLKQMARPMARLLAPGGRVMLSGLLANQAQAALAAYRPQGLVLERRIALEGWVTLVMRRPPLPR
jgi:ribosomal protein L11 methyltransferase